LLYRPRQTPDEPVLEAILASLSGVQEFKELVRCVEGLPAAQTVALHVN